jgi:hypothetical protein
MVIAGPKHLDSRDHSASPPPWPEVRCTGPSAHLERQHPRPARRARRESTAWLWVGTGTLARNQFLTFAAIRHALSSSPRKFPPSQGHLARNVRDAVHADMTHVVRRSELHMGECIRFEGACESNWWLRLGFEGRSNHFTSMQKTRRWQFSPARTQHFFASRAAGEPSVPETPAAFLLADREDDDRISHSNGGVTVDDTLMLGVATPNTEFHIPGRAGAGSPRSAVAIEGPRDPRRTPGHRLPLPETSRLERSEED